MGLFKKKEPPVPVQVPKKCAHKWKDFDWYMYSSYNKYYQNLHIEIIEPYVCVWCKERENKVLFSNDFDIKSYGAALQKADEIHDLYKDKIKPRAIVEDQIADMQHSIDHDYLRIVAKCFPDKLGLTPEEVKKLSI